MDIEVNIIELTSKRTTPLFLSNPRRGDRRRGGIGVERRRYGH